MSHLTAITPVETYAPPVDRSRRNYRHIRVLRWTFRRDDEAVVCELALTGEDREYECGHPLTGIRQGWRWSDSTTRSPRFSGTP